MEVLLTTRPSSAQQILRGGGIAIIIKPAHQYHVYGWPTLNEHDDRLDVRLQDGEPLCITVTTTASAEREEKDVASAAS